MLVNCDIKGLEVVVAADLSGDETLKQEIIDKVDIHDENRRTFGLGDGKPGRLVAKIFKFRLIYGGSAWSYANDPDFTGVSSSQKFWQRVIDRYYEKYSGIKRWHDQLLRTVKEQGHLEIPSGRYYTFAPVMKRGEWAWPLTQIKNYPVQGFGADLVMLFRIELYRLLKQANIEFVMVQTIHDSVVVDTPEKNVPVVSQLCHQAIANVPDMCYNNWSYEFSLPLSVEVQVGYNKKELSEFHE